MQTLKVSKPTWIRTILTVVLMESFLGGGGRIFDFGFLSLRMYLFIISLVVALVLILFSRRKVDISILTLLAVLTFMIVVSSIIGFINQAKTAMILNDIKPLISIYIILFFFVAIRTTEDVLFVRKLIMLASLILAFSYLSIFYLLNTSRINFISFYSAVSSTEEFFFRGNFAFFYKGFIYLCVGVIFLIGQSNSKIIVMILLLSILLTFTRGFILSVASVYIIYLIFIKRKAIRFLMTVMIFGLAAWLGWGFVNNAKKIDRNRSDDERIQQITEVRNHATGFSVFLGNGFGVGIPSRPERMEITYLEIFHKQGIFGILCWAMVLYVCYTLFRKGDSQLLTSFFLSVVFVFIQSFTNPFLNNPIGIYLISISVVCMSVLVKNR